MTIATRAVLTCDKPGCRALYQRRDLTDLLEAFSAEIGWERSVYLGSRAMDRCPAHRVSPLPAASTEVPTP